MIESFIFVCIIIWLIWKWWNRNYNYWQKRGFPYIPSSWPLGDLSELLLLNRYQGVAVKKIYDKTKDQPYVGLVIGRRPHLIINSPSIIKSIMLKDFNHFTDRISVDAISSQASSRNLFNLGGDSWKAYRTKMSPIFSSGKLKLMFSLFQRCAEQLNQAIDSKVGFDVDIKNIMSRFTTDVISSCAFGLDANSLERDDSQIHDIATQIFPTSPTLKSKIFITINGLLPGIENWYRPNLIDDNVETYMTHLVPETIKDREASGIRRNDLIDLLIEIQKSGKINVDKSYEKEIEITDEDLVAQVFVFLAAGFETSSSVSTYCLYELAINMEIQDKLRNEILETEKIHGSLTYQAIMEMPYLDQVISETMRKYPTIPVLSRKCTKSYRMPDRPDLILEKGTRILIPTYALHYDTDYFPNPEKFDPERFSQLEKGKIAPFTYLPFGEGPRLCIGMRFGLLQTKMGVATVIRKYRVSITPRTPVPLEFGPSRLITVVEDPIYLNISKCA